MKKLFIVFTILLLCGCNKEEVKLDLNKIKVDLENLTYEEEPMFKNANYYTLDSIAAKYDVDLDFDNIDEYLINIPISGEKANMYIIVSASTSKKELKADMDELLSKIEAAWGNGYKPEEEAKIDNRLEREYGNYLIYIISDDNDLVYNKIKE